MMAAAEEATCNKSNIFNEKENCKRCTICDIFYVPLVSENSNEKPRSCGQLLEPPFNKPRSQFKSPPTSPHGNGFYRGTQRNLEREGGGP